jgi:hypothetical protein
VGVDSTFVSSVAASAPVFIQQDPSAQGASVGGTAPQAYWYYCTSPAGYYPYVQACSNAWVPVIPQGPSAGGAPQAAPN